MPIKNVDDLHSEILRLTALKQLQKEEIGMRFNSPSATFSTLLTAFPATGDNTRGGSFFNMDMVSMLSRILLPLTLNKTLFRRSNFIVKALVGFISQRASGFINEKAVGGIWDKAKALFGKVTSKKPPVKRLTGYTPPM